MRHHVRPVSQSRQLPRKAVGIIPPTTLLGKIAQALGLKEF